MEGFSVRIKTIALSALLIFACQSFAFASKNFTDVSSQAGYSQEITALAENGIFEGDENGNFRPDDSITRAEFSVVLCRAMGLEETAKTAEMINLEYFVDVPNTHWAGCCSVNNRGIYFPTLAPQGSNSKITATLYALSLWVSGCRLSHNILI
jgi:hypothetical protein